MLNFCLTGAYLRPAAAWSTRRSCAAPMRTTQSISHRRPSTLALRPEPALVRPDHLPQSGSIEVGGTDALACAAGRALRRVREHKSTRDVLSRRVRDR
jgi:hypothetical protein